MGGGKTHLLVGFGLLAKSRALRQRYFPGVAYADAFDSAAIAAFNGRNTPNHFFWGEIAEQLGKGSAFSQFWTSGPKAPDERHWIDLLSRRAANPDPARRNAAVLSLPLDADGRAGHGRRHRNPRLREPAHRRRQDRERVHRRLRPRRSLRHGGALIHRALADARSELGRQERTITPVDLAANEIYDVLRKQLFIKLPSDAEIMDVAAHYGQKLEEAAKAKTARRGAEAIADEIAATYPFHPRLKNVVALFKENQRFKQTRGVLELVSRLLRSVWERADHDVFLIGAQHFDLSIPEVRDKLTEISGMRDVIATDVWDLQQSAHAQRIDHDSGTDSAAQIGALLLIASLSTAVKAVRGLTRDEMVECLASPLREPSACRRAHPRERRLRSERRTARARRTGNHDRLRDRASTPVGGSCEAPRTRAARSSAYPHRARARTALPPEHNQRKDRRHPHHPMGNTVGASRTDPTHADHHQPGPKSD